MICKVRNTIEKYKLLENVSSVAVGVSGGADSMCLLHILIKLKVEYGIIVKAVHLNHNLRGEEAKRDENHVRDFCRKNGVELTVFSEDIASLSKKLGIGEEECGRKVRYESFSKMNCDAVAVAHTLSDSAETVLFNLARGTGSKGICGITPKREPNIIRPLIECTRQEIEIYCKLNCLDYVTDSTNLSDDYQRNYVRHNIIPAFSHINQNSDLAIARTSVILKEESDFIDECALKLIEKAETDKGYKVSAFLDSHAAVRKRAFSILLSKKMNKAVEAKHIELCENALLKQKGKIEIAKDLYISFDSDIINFCSFKSKCEKWTAEFKDNKAESPYGVYYINELSPYTAGAIDKDKIKGKPVLSSRREGDRFHFENRRITKTLKKLFSEMKIPVYDRERIAVLHDDENVIWVEGIGIDGKYLSDEKSQSVFVIIKEGQKDVK